MSLFSELRRRNVFRAATAYVVSAWLVVQVVETLFPIFGLSAEAIRLVVILLAIGFLPAVIVAWVFQLTPEGLKLDPGSGRSAPGASRMLDRIIIVTLVIGLCYFAIDKFLLAPERIADREAEVAEQAADEARKGFYGDRSIAVLPFDNMSPDPEQVHFADGIAEEVLNLLARIRELRVISRSSAFALRGRDLGVPEIAEILDVGHVLEGSVRKAGEQVRVTVQLIEARTDTHLWSKTYTQKLDDVFRIQDEIAADVARNLHIALLQPLPRSRYIDPEVRALVEQAELLAQSRPDGAGEKMYALLSRALEIDPDYVPALVAMTYAEYFRSMAGTISTEEAEQRYRQLEARILELDPDNAYIDYARAFDLELAGELEEAAQMYLKALSRDMTDSEQIRLAGGFARRIGKFDVSRRLLRHAVAIDPLCFQCLYQLSNAYLYSGDYERAKRVRERYLGLGSGGHYFYGLMLLLQGNPQAALDSVAGDDDAVGTRSTISAMAWHSLGDPEKAGTHFARLIEAHGNDDPLLVAEAAAWMGNADTAFEWLQKARPGEAAIRIFLPVYASLHDDPRWDALRESLGRSAARLDAIEFDPVMPD
jgi:adenylate cyclase